MQGKQFPDQVPPEGKDVAQLPNEHRPRVLIFIVAYNAEKTIVTVLARIPASLGVDYDV